MNVDGPTGSVPQIRPPQIEEMVRRLVAMKADAEKLGLDVLAHFLDMCLIEARFHAERRGEGNA